MAPIILGNSPESGVGNNVILADASNLGTVSNILVPYKDQYRVIGGSGGIAIGNTADTRLFSTGTVIMAGTNVTISTSALGAQQYLNLSVADPAAAGNYVSAGDYVSLSTAGYGTTVSITGLQPAGAYLTTAALSDHNHGGTAFATGSINGTIGTYTSGTGTYISGTDTYSTTYTYNGWSLSIPDFLTTAALSDHSHTDYAGTGVSTGTTLGTEVKATLSTNGLSFRTPRYITTAAQISHIHGTISTVSTTGSLISYTSSSNGLTLGMPQWITTATGINNVALSGNTSGTMTELSAATITIAGGDNITLSQDGNAFTIMGAASGTNAGIAFSMSDSNTSGTKSLISTGTLYLEGGNNVTISQNSNSIQIIAAVGGGAALQGSGTYTQNTGTIQFANSNNITFGLTDNQMTASFSESTHDHPYLNIAESTYYQTSNLSSVFLTTAALSDHVHSQYVNTSISSQWLTTALDPDYTSHSHTQYLTTAMESDMTSVFQYTSQSSLFQLTADNSLSLGTTYTSHTHLYQSTGDYLTTAMQSDMTSAFEYTSHTSAITSNAVNTSATSAYQLIVNSSNSLGTTYTSHSHTQYLTTAALSNHSHGNISLALTNISGTTASASSGMTLSLSGPDVGGAQTGISGIVASDATYTSGTVIVSGQNNITVGSSINGGSQYIRLSVGNYLTTALGTDYTSHTHSQYVNTSASSLLQHTSATSNITSNALNTSQSSVFQLTANNSLSLGTTYTSHTHTYLTTAALSNHSHGAGSLSLNGISGTYSSASNGWTLSLTNSTHEHPYLNTSQSSVFQLTSDNSLSLGTTYTSHTHTYLGTQSNQAISGSNGSSTFQTISFGNSNNHSFYLTNGSLVASFSESTHVHPYVNTSQSSLFEQTSHTSAITASALNTSQSSLFQLTADNSLSLGTVYTTHTHNYAGTNTAMTGGTLTVNTSGVSIHVQERSLNFADSNGITFGGSIDGYSTTITGSINALGSDYSTHTHSQYINTSVSSQFTTQSYQPVAFSGSNSSTTASTISFGNSNGLSFYLTNGSLVGSYSVPSGVSGFWELEGTNTAGTTGSEFQTLFLSGGQNVTLEGSSNTIIFNVNATGAQDGGNVLAVSGSTASSTGTVALWNANNFTFGFSDNTRITASFSESTHAHPYIASQSTSVFQYTSNTSLITSNAFNTSQSSLLQLTANNSLSLGTDYTSHTHIYAGTNTAITGGSLTVNTNGISLDIQQNSLNFSDGNGITFGGSVDGHSTTVTGSIDALGTVYTSAFLYTSNSSLLQHTSATSAITSNALNTSQSSLFQLTANNSLSLGTTYTSHTHSQYVNTSVTSQWLTTAALSNHSHGNPTLALTNLSGTTNSNSAGFTLSLSAPDVAGAQTGISGIGVSNTTYTSGTVIWSGQNNITIGSSVNGASQYVRLSVPDAIPLSASTAYQTSVLDDTFLTTGYTSHTHSQYAGTNGAMTGGTLTVNTSGVSVNVQQRSLYYADTNGVTFSTSVDGYTTTVSASVVAGIGTDYTSHTHSQYVNTSQSSLFQLLANSTLSLGTVYTSHTHPYIASQSTSVFQFTSNTSNITSNALNTSQSSLFQHTSATSNITSNALNTSVSSNFQLVANSSNSLGTTYTSHTHNYLTGETQTFVSGIANSQTTFTSGNIVFSGQTNITVNSSSGTGASSNSQYILFSGPNNINEIQAQNGTIFGGSAYLSGDNMTISLDGRTVHFSAPTAGTAGGGSVYAGSYITLSTSSNSTTVSVTNTSDFTYGHGNFVNTSQTGSVYFISSSGNITWSSSSTSNSTYLYGSAPSGGGGVAMQGSGTYTQNTGTVQFVNSNGLTFGLSNNGVMTGSVANNAGSLYFADSNGVSFGVTTNTNSQSTITASVNTVEGGVLSWELEGANTAGTTGSSGNTLFLSGGNNVTLSGNSNTIVISLGTAAGGADGVNIIAAGGSTANTTGTIVFSNSNGLSFGLNGSIVTASHNALTTAMLSNASTGFMLTGERGNYFYTSNNTFANSTHSHGNPSLYLTNVSGTTNSNSAGLSLSLSVGNYLTTAALSNHSHAFSASGGSSAFQTLNFTNSNGITFSNTNGSVRVSHALQYTSNTSAITASAMNTSERGNYFYTSNNTFANSTHTHGNISLALTNITGTTASASNGMTLSLSAGAGVGGGAALQGSGTYTQNTGTIQFANSNGITFGLTENQMTASIYDNIGSLHFVDSNGVTFGISTSANSQSTVTASVNVGGGGTSIVPGSWLSSSLNGSTLSLSVTGLQATSATSAITASAMNTSERVNYFYTSNRTFMGTGTSTQTTTATNLALSGNTNGLTITYPAVGYLSLVNSNGYTWSSSVNGVSSAIWLVLAHTA